MSGFTDGFGNFGKLVGQSANAGLGSLATGLISGGLGQMFDAFSARRDWKYRQKEMAAQQEYNERNMALQNQYAVDFWKMNNEYNDPKNAVARWRAAGIAPQSVFGSSPGGAGVAGSTETPSSSNPAASGSGSRGYVPTMTIAEVAAMRNQERLTDADVKLKNAEARRAQAEAEGQENENSVFGITKDIMEANRDSAKAKAWQEQVDASFAMLIKGQEVDKNREEINNLISDQFLKESGIEVNEAQIARLRAAAGLDEARKENVEAQTKTEDELRENRKKLLDADIKRVLAEVGLTESQIATANLDLIRKALFQDESNTIVAELKKIGLSGNRDLYGEHGYEVDAISFAKRRLFQLYEKSYKESKK